MTRKSSFRGAVGTSANIGHKRAHRSSPEPCRERLTMQTRQLLWRVSVVLIVPIVPIVQVETQVEAAKTASAVQGRASKTPQHPPHAQDVQLSIPLPLKWQRIALLLALDATEC